MTRILSGYTNPSDENFLIVEKAIDRMQLRDFALRYTDELSGGELQKVIIARALAQQHTILLLDEPTSNLDSLNEAVILKSLAEERKDKTVVLVSHRASTMRIADRTYSVENGRMS